MITEPDVTLTDYGLAVEAGMFAWLLRRGSDPSQPLGRWFVLFFASISAASLAGGTVHGFFLDPTTMGSRILWPATLIAIGGTALAAWGVGAHIQFSARAALWVARAASLEFVFYAGLVMFGAQTFKVAILNYLPPVIFLLMVFVLAFARVGDRAALLGAAGMFLTFAAAAAQQARVALHPHYFTHNAVYHLIQGVALAVVFASARGFARRRPC